MARFPRLILAISRGILPGILLPLAVHAQNSPQRAEQQAVAAWLAADRATLAKETYTVPPEDIRRMVEAPWDLNVAFSSQSPTRKYFLNIREKQFPPLSAFGKPHLYFGGLEVDPKANRNRSLTTHDIYALEVVDATTGKRTAIQAPKDITLGSPTWSPDGAHLAFIANADSASYIYVADPVTGKSTRITTTPLLATLVTTLKWTADSKHVVAVLLPEPRAAEPKQPAVATGPVTQLWMDGKRDAERNFWSLLQTPYDEDLMEYYITGQLATIDIGTKAVRKVGPPAMIDSVDPSPDGEYFRVVTMQRPFSFVVQYTSFGRKNELWDASGKVLAQISSHGVRLASDSTPGARGFGRGRGGDPNEPKRDLAWMPRGAGVYYLDPVPATDDGRDTTSGSATAARRRGAAAPPTRVVEWLPPFGPNDTKILFTDDAPINSVAFSDDAKMLFVADTRNGAGEIFAVSPNDPSTRHVIVRPLAGYTPSLNGGRNVDNAIGAFLGEPGSPGDSAAYYGNPGALVSRPGTRGGQVAMVSPDGAVFLQGTQRFPDYLHHPPREFVDKVDITTGTKTRVFEAANDVHESIVAPLDEEFSRVIVNRESPTQIANVYLHDGSELRKLTENKDYTPEFTNEVRKRIVVTRADGIKFEVDLNLPQGYRAGTRLPGMFWFYPREYTDQASYDRTLRPENVNAFPQMHPNPRPVDYLTTQGYAVAFFNPPIVGPEGRMNDNYITDLVMDLSAVIDELDRDGYIDRSRLGIGGHSYGAFSTMNALAHTPFFRAGIAGDGMSNRSLTPDGFQSERRDFWTAQRTYEEMSPFFYADKIQGALLMYHSMEDQNVGTNLISSERMMQALRANGKPSALFIYPYENHQPATLETELDQWARWVAWLDIYVKHAGEGPAPAQQQIIP